MSASIAPQFELPWEANPAAARRVEQEYKRREAAVHRHRKTICDEFAAALLHGRASEAPSLRERTRAQLVSLAAAVLREIERKDTEGQR